MNCPRIASVLLACLLVTAGVAGPLSQPAAAATAGNCSDLDDFVMFATLGAVNSEDCSREAYVQDAIADYEQTDAEQTKVDIYSQAQSLDAGQRAYMAPFNNYLADTEQVAWSKMQVAVAEAYKNGSSKAQARHEAEQAIEEYYAVKQVNLVQQYNANIADIRYLRNQAQSEGNITADGFIGVATNGAGDQDIVSAGSDPVNQSTTLVNGSSTTVELLYRYDAGQSNDRRALEIDVTPAHWNSQYAETGIFVAPPTQSYTRTEAVDFRAYEKAWSEIENRSAAVTSEAKNFVDASYDDFSSGSANASDVIDANTAMFEYGVRTSNDSESLWSSTAALSLMGFDTPDLNSSGTMDVAHQGTNYTGLIMAREAPGGSWSAGTTYNTSNIAGPVFMLTTDGTKVDFANGTEFTVEALRAKDGSSVSSVNTTVYSYKTANTSELVTLQSRLTDLRQQIEDREPAGGGGGSGGFGGNSMLLLLAAAAAAAIALGSQNGGGGNNRSHR